MSSTQVLAIDSAAYGEAKGLRRGEDIMDALAYIDGKNNESQDRAENLIKEEVQQLRKMGKRAADYLPELPKLHQVKFTKNPLLQTEYERVRADQPMPQSDQLRLKCPAPPENRKNDVSAWHASLDNAHSQLEHQYNRLQNLELVLEYGPKTWQAYIRGMEHESKRLESAKSKLEREIENVNKRRKLKQLATGKELQETHEGWKSLLDKNSEIVKANAGLDAEIAKLYAQLPSETPSQQQAEIE